MAFLCYNSGILGGITFDGRYRMRNKNGFTLSEVMVTMAILGVLAAVIVSSISAMKPNVEKLMFKKAYRIAEAVVADMISDTSLYPPNYEGESLFTSPADGVDFCSEFAKRVNTVDGESCNDSDGNISFTTTDGVEWAMVSSFSGDLTRIYIDVNTKDSSNDVKGGTEGSDWFTINVTKDGKVSPVQQVAKNYLKDPFTTRSGGKTTSSSTSSGGVTTSTGGGCSNGDSDGCGEGISDGCGVN